MHAFFTRLSVSIHKRHLFPLVAAICDLRGAILFRSSLLYSPFSGVVTGSFELVLGYVCSGELDVGMVVVTNGYQHLEASAPDLVNALDDLLDSGTRKSR